jgi:hypothetical protein
MKRSEVAALGASFLFFLAPFAHADDEATPPRPAASGVSDVASQKAAAERWKKLKAQYSAQNPSRTSTAGSAEGEFRISAKPRSETITQGVAESRQATIPAESEAEPEWVLPVPGTQTDLAAAQPTRTNPSQASDDKEKDAGLLKPDVPSPDETDPIRGTRRSGIPMGVPAGPPRKSTQVRRIGDISPLNDLERHSDIRQYAAEKAREINVKFGGDKYSQRDFPDVAFQWAAPTTMYYPLYFQDPQLERYGHTYPFPLQPVASVTRMTGQLLLMPYQMTITPPWTLESPLGWYRPGDMAPKLHYQFPWNTSAAVVEAGVITGLFFLIP